MQSPALLKQLADCRVSLDNAISQCTVIHTTSKAADLLLLAKTWPTLDDTLKTMLLQIAGHPEAFQHSDLLSFLTGWMMDTTSPKYSLFVEVLKEISKQNQAPSPAEKSIMAEKSEVLGVCCEYVYDEIEGVKTCQKHHEAPKRRTKPPKAEVTKEHGAIQCQIAVGDDLLRLTPCKCPARAQLRIHGGQVISLCPNHLMEIRSQNPLPTSPPSTDYIVDGLTPIKLFNPRYLNHWNREATGWCQGVTGSWQKCNQLAAVVSGYGAPICEYHYQQVCRGKDLDRLSVKR